MKYHDAGDDNHDTDSSSNSNVGIPHAKYISIFSAHDFSFKYTTKTIEQNQQKYETNFIGRLLGSIVPILLENREERKFNEGIKNIVEDFIKHGLGMMVIDVATENQKTEE